MPVFGGWLRNVEDERMEATWDYVKRLAQRSEEIGYDLTLIAELNLNDIKGIDAPSLDAWSTAAALAAVTESLELMVAVRPTFHPAGAARQAGREHRSHHDGRCRSTSSRRGGPTKRSSTACSSTSTTTATRAPRNGSTWSTGAVERGPFLVHREISTGRGSRARAEAGRRSRAR